MVDVLGPLPHQLFQRGKYFEHLESFATKDSSQSDGMMHLMSNEALVQAAICLMSDETLTQAVTQLWVGGRHVSNLGSFYNSEWKHFFPADNTSSSKVVNKVPL